MTTPAARVRIFWLALALSTIGQVAVLSPTASGVDIWDGGGANDNWTTGANWFALFGPGIPPANNGTADLVFPASGGLVQTPVVDVPYSIRSTQFGNGDGRFVILGAAELTIGAGGITNNDADLQAIAGVVKLSANQTWNAAAGPLQMDAVNLNGFGLNLAGNFAINLASVIVGSGGLALDNSYANTVTMLGGSSNTYTGLTSVEGGTLKLQKSGGATAVPGHLYINAGGNVLLAGNEQISHASGNQVFIGIGTLNLNGYTETIDYLDMVGGDVATGTGMLKIGQIVAVRAPNATITGNITLGDVTASVYNGGHIDTPSSIIIGDAANGSLDVTSGGEVSNGASWIGYLPGSTGAVTVSGAGSIWNNSSFLGIGEFGAGSLAVTLGGRVSDTHATVGQSGAGTALVAGAGSTWTNTEFLEVGNNNTGSLTIEDGGVVSNTDAFIGHNPGSTGTVVVRGTDSTWTNNGQLSVGVGGSGTLNIEAGGKVSVTGGTSVNSTSQISVSQSTFTASGNLSIDGGSLTADANASVAVAGGVIRNGASVTVKNGATITGSLDLVSDATMQVTSGATFTTGFSRIGTQGGPAAELTVDGSNTKVLAPSCCIDVGYGGTGVMTVTGGARVETLTGAVGSFDPGSVGTVTLDGTDASGNPSSWISSNLNMGLEATSQGTLQVRNGALFRATSPTYGLAVGTPGTAQVLVEGTDGLGNPSLLDAAALSIGTGYYGNGTGEVTASAGGRIAAGNILLAPMGGTATLTLTDTNTALVQSGASTITVGHVTDGSATINLRNNAQFTTGTGAIGIYPTGRLNLESAAVLDARGPINMQGGQFNFLGGTLHVDTFNGSLLNQGGTLAPGHSAGTTAVTGNYTQRPAAALEIEVGGVLPGDWDVLAVEGNAILEGTIEVKLIDDFEPVLGNSFTIITTDVGNVGGQFDTELLPIINDLTFDVIYNPKSVVLTVIEAPVLLGDYSRNGVVDAADYTVWRDNLGRGSSLPNDDTAGVGQDDYERWTTHFGEMAGSGSAGASPSQAAVPEPVVLTLVLGVVVVTSCVRCGRQSGN